MLPFRTKKGALAWCTPHGPLASHIRSSVRYRHHPATSPAFASDRPWDGWLECTLVAPAYTPPTCRAILSVTNFLNLVFLTSHVRAIGAGPARLPSEFCSESTDLGRNYLLEKFPSIPGNGHTHAKLSRPGRPYSSEVYSSILRTPVRPASFSILVTGTNCNGQGVSVQHTNNTDDV